ncbi:MAG: ATP-binding protein [Butyricicoccus sp.]|nr:ATP-binding protein [Butyricicoccus sp.]
MKNLLTLAKLDENSGKLPESVFSANLLLEELLDPYYEIAAEKGVSLSADFQSGVSLRANRESITQLFSILLDNAAKYTPSGGGIEASLSENGKHVVFALRNTCDIPEDTNLRKLFDRFYRCDSARTQKDGGCGIGLSAAQAIVHAHGGTITASREGDSILFTVKL